MSDTSTKPRPSRARKPKADKPSANGSTEVVVIDKPQSVQRASTATDTEPPTPLALPTNRGGVMTIVQIKDRVNFIRDVMREVLDENVHYGKVPGCGDKQCLYKAGAEKLAMTFCLTVSYDETIIDLPNGHREVRIKSIVSNYAGEVIAEGVGSCSTMEKKYRYRTVRNDIPTTTRVPKEFWNARNNELPENDLQAILCQEMGRDGRWGTRKIDGQWMIVERGDDNGQREENPDLADTYNTVLKMAKKRSHVDGIITATSTSDILTQDMEEHQHDDDQSSRPLKTKGAEPPKGKTEGNGNGKSNGNSEGGRDRKTAADAYCKIVPTIKDIDTLKALWETNKAEIEKIDDEHRTRCRDITSKRRDELKGVAAGGATLAGPELAKAVETASREIADAADQKTLADAMNKHGKLIEQVSKTKELKAQFDEAYAVANERINPAPKSGDEIDWS